MFVSNGFYFIVKLSIFLLTFGGAAAIAGETTPNIHIDAAIQSAMDSARQAVLQAKDKAHQCALSGVSSHTVTETDKKIKSNIYNCANSNGANASVEIGNQTISSGHGIKSR